MRDLILVAATLAMLPVVVRFPQAGVLACAWFSIMAPHRETYGFAMGQPRASASGGRRMRCPG
jgi:putative inorganic carbon (HCO3(-)) transporter